MEYQKKSYRVDTGGLRGELPLTDFQKQQIEEYISSLFAKSNIYYISTTDKERNYMKILDYFEHPRFGVIVSSTDSKFDNFSDDEIKKRIGDTIVLVQLG